MTKPTLGIGILSWRAHKTLRQSLQSYQASGFLDLFDQKVIYFGDITDEDRAIAAEFGWEAAGGPNMGIGGGMKNLALSLNTDYVVLLQNDNPLVESTEFARQHLQEAVTLLEQGQAHLVRLRHRWQVGEGFVDVNKYLRYFPARQIADNYLPSEHHTKEGDYPDSVLKKLRRLLNFPKAKRLSGRCIFIEQHPEQLYPRTIRKAGEFLLVDSSVINFSDQCLLLSRDFFLNTLVAYVEAYPSSRTMNGFQVIEICLNRRWWRQGGFISAQGRGLFTHSRKDGSFRPNHPAYEKPN